MKIEDTLHNDPRVFNPNRAHKFELLLYQRTHLKTLEIRRIKDKKEGKDIYENEMIIQGYKDEIAELVFELKPKIVVNSVSS